MVRRRDLPAGPPDQRGADREDPHGRVDARGHRPSDDEDRDAGQLVRAGRRAGAQAVRPAQRQRGHQRHPRLADRALRRAVLADRGVRGGLPDAPADARRLQPALQRRRPGADAGDPARPGRAERARRGSTRSASRTCSTRSAPQHPGLVTLHNFPRFLQEFERPDGNLHGPRRDRHPALPRAGRAALQRVPPAAAPRPGRRLRRPHRQPGVGAGDRAASTTGTSSRST